MTVVLRSGRGIALAVCCGMLAVPATASASHMGDMPWCPHANVQGADPADALPGGNAGGTMRASEAPLGGTSSSDVPASPAKQGPAPSSRAAPVARAPVTTSASQGAAQAPAGQGAAVASGQVTAAVAQPATVAAVTDGRRVALPAAAAPDPAAARALAKARAQARLQARREARGLARARAAARAERAREARGVQAVARVRLSSPEWWLARSVTDRGGDGTRVPAPVAALVTLLTMAALAAALIARRRSGGQAVAVPVAAPPDGPSHTDAAIEAELQEIIAEARAAQAADARRRTLSG